MARRRGEVESAGSNDFLIYAVGGVLILGFIALSVGGAGPPVGGCDAAHKQASTNAISNYMGNFITNHLNKALPSAMNVTTLIRTKYPSGLSQLAMLNNCGTSLPTGNPSFYKVFAAVAIAVPAGIGSGYALSSGVLADMTAMKADGNGTHLTKYSHYTSAKSLATRTELEELAKKLQLEYGEVYHDVHGYPGMVDSGSVDIYDNVQNADDYTTIESLV